MWEEGTVFVTTFILPSLQPPLHPHHANFVRPVTEDMEKDIVKQQELMEMRRR